MQKLKRVENEQQLTNEFYSNYMNDPNRLKKAGTRKDELENLLIELREQSGNSSRLATNGDKNEKGDDNVILGSPRREGPPSLIQSGRDTNRLP